MPSFTAHPLAVRALSLDLPDGPMADLACGPSGSALLAAAQGRPVTAVDISEVALWLLGDEARHRDLGGLITLVHADLSAWSLRPGSHALVLCTGFWAAQVFAAAAEAVVPGGLLAWQAYTGDARERHPSLRPEWCLAPGEPASLLPAGFSLLDQSEVVHCGQLVRRQMLARRTAPSPPASGGRRRDLDRGGGKGGVLQVAAGRCALGLILLAPVSRVLVCVLRLFLAACGIRLFRWQHPLLPFAE
ncbi:MAG: class I SAM-dependent methyltransferase [Streptosporangiaceae bacterium]